MVGMLAASVNLSIMDCIFAAMGSVTTLTGQHDVATHYVRVTTGNHRGYVEFQYSVGDPSLYLEMTLPPAAFAEFCHKNEVCVLSEEQGRVVDAAERRWRFGDDEDEKELPS
jgi:phenol hydroxylase P0 protein